MNQIYSIKYRILIVLIVSIVPLHALCADYFTVNGINYQVISSSAKTVRVGWHITNGTSVSYQNSPTALSNTSMTGSVEIPSVVGGYTVVEVDSHAFSGTKLTSIVLPSSVKTIKSSAFGSTSSLKEIFIPNSVTKIEGSAFSGCSGLYEIYIPESITALNGSTFRNCKNLTIVHFSESLEKLGTYDFYGCTSLKSIVFPTSLKSFYGYNFESTGFQQLDLPNSLTWIGSDFKNCSQLVSLIMGENIATGDAFRECEKLKHIWVKNTNPSSCSKSFVNIASGARLYVPVGTKSKYASLEGWNNIPNIAEVIGDVLFILSNSDEVTEYMVTNREKKEVQIGTNSFAAISDEKTTYEIPPTITNTSGEVFNVVGIGNNAFLGCANLESLRIPQNILKISSAFNGCVKLRSIYFDSRNPSDIEFESNCFDELPSDACFYVPAGTKSRYEALGVIKNSSQIVEVSPLSIGDVATVLGSQANMPIILNSAEVISGIQCKLTLPEGVSLVEEEGEPVVSLTNRTEGFTVMGHKILMQRTVIFL